MLRGDPLDPRNEAWANKVVALERVGRFGTDSCSPTGLGGFTGCTQALLAGARAERRAADKTDRSEEHTSELQSLMRNSYAVFCLKKPKMDKSDIGQYKHYRNRTHQSKINRTSTFRP